MAFPPEILIQIIQYNISTVSWFSELTRARTDELLSYSLVNQLFRSISQEHLYTHAALDCDKIGKNIRNFLFSARKLYLEDKVIQVQLTADYEVSIKDSLKTLLTQCTQVKSLSFFDVKNIQGRDLAMAQSEYKLLLTLTNFRRNNLNSGLI